jgi:hypothetical protein
MGKTAAMLNQKPLIAGDRIHPSDRKSRSWELVAGDA